MVQIKDNEKNVCEYILETVRISEPRDLKCHSRSGQQQNIYFILPKDNPSLTASSYLRLRMQHKVRLLEPDRICECGSSVMTILTTNGMGFLSVHTSASRPECFVTKIVSLEERMTLGDCIMMLECRELGFVDLEIYQ